LATKIGLPKLSKRGQSFTEYVVIVGIIAVAVVAALYLYNTKVRSNYRGAADQIAAVDAGASSTGSYSPSSASEFEKIQTKARTMWADPRFKLGLLGLVFLLMCLIVFNQYRAQKKLGKTQSLSGETGEDGQAMTEFVLAFPVLLLSILIIFQMSLLYAGHFMLNYAAYCAVRTAVVWIPQDMTEDDTGGGENTLNLSGEKTAKLDKIKNAARFACAPISPPMSLLISQRVQEAENAANNFNITDLSNLVDNFISSAISNFGQGMADKAKDAFAEIANPMNYINPFGSFDSSTSSESADSGSPLDLSGFLSEAFKDTIQSFQNIQNYLTGLTGDSSTVLEGLEEPVIPEAPGLAGVLQRFFDKYAVSYLLTSVEILDSNLTAVSSATKDFAADEDVIVEVKHWFHLGIPIANGIIGKKIYYWDGEFSESQYAGLSPTGMPGVYYPMSSRCIMPNEGRMKCSDPPGPWDWF